MKSFLAMAVAPIILLFSFGADNDVCTHFIQLLLQTFSDGNKRWISVFRNAIKVIFHVQIYAINLQFIKKRNLNFMGSYIKIF